MDDWNGDGHADYAVERREQVELVSGASGEAILRFDPPSGSVGFGTALCALPDLDGDGKTDLAVGAPGNSFESAAQMPNPHLGIVELRSSRDGRVLRTLRSEQPSSEFGWALAVIENRRAPSQSLLVVAEHDDQSNGNVHSVHSRASVFRLRDGSFAYAIHGGADSWNQWNPASCGDLDGDGFSDLVLGGDRTATLISGREGRVLRTIDLAHGGHPIPSDDTFDLDRDGTPDVAIAEHVFDPLKTDGAVEVFSGRDGRRLWSAQCLAFDGSLLRVEELSNGPLLAITGSVSLTLFAPPALEPLVTLSLEPMRVARIACVGDVDADGSRDLVVADASDAGLVGILTTRTLREAIRR